MSVQQPQTQTYTYYAFISYSHRDKAAARRLQNALERSRIPAALHRANSGITKKIAPIFRDDTDLVSHSSLINDLRGELAASRYLILLCSPDSARSAWVDEEVRAFVAMGRADRIIPVIVSGAPHSGDPAAECFPPALLAMGSRAEPLAIDMKEHGRRGTYLRVLASLLGVRLNEIADRDKKLRRRRAALRTACCAILAMAAAFLLWYNVPVKTYYKDYACRWDMPVGLERVSRAERKERGFTYCITKKRGRAISLERLNSAGALTEPEIADYWTEPARILYFYEDNGLFGKKTLRGKEYYGTDGKKLYSLRYTSPDGGNTRAVDLTAPDNNSSAFGAEAYSATLFLQAMNPDADDPASVRTPISRYLQTYNARGYMTTRRYMRDGWNHPTCNADGVYGMRYEYDAAGRVRAVLFLDAAGEVSKCGGISVGELYEYNGGELTTAVRLAVYADAEAYRPIDGSGLWVCQKRVYDKSGRVTSLHCLDKDRQPTASAEYLGAAALSFKYNARGLPTETAFLDVGGSPAVNADGYAVIKRTFDNRGRVTREAFFGTDGKETCCLSDGTAVTDYTYDKDGRLTKLEFLDSAYLPTVNLSLGCCRIAYGYENGRVSSVEYLSAAYKPTLTPNGFAKKEYRYNDEGQRTQTAFFDADGSPVAAGNGAAIIRYAYRDGTLERIAYCDADGAPVMNAYGYSIYRFERKDGLVSAYAYFDAQERPAAPYADRWARMEVDYDEFARPTEERYYGEDGAPVNANAGYAVRRYKWDGSLKDKYLDESGAEITPDAAAAERSGERLEMVLVNGFAEGYPAAENAGMRAYDVIVRYNDWRFADCCDDPARTEAEFSAATAAGRDAQKSVDIVRRTADGGRETVSLTLPEGIAGFLYGGVYVSRGYLEKYVLN